MVTLEEIFERLRPVFDLNLRRIDVRESGLRTRCVALVLLTGSRHAEDRKHRYFDIGHPFVHLNDGGDAHFLFDTRLPKTPQQLALERRTPLEFKDDEPPLPSEIPKTAKYDGTLYGCMLAEDLDLAEAFLQQYKNVVKHPPWSVENDVYFEDDIYAERFGVYGTALQKSNVGFIELLLRYNHKMPETAVRDALSLVEGSADDVRTVQLVLTNGGEDQVTAKTLFECFQLTTLAFSAEEIEKETPDETEARYMRMMTIFRMLQMAFQSKMARTVCAYLDKR